MHVLRDRMPARPVMSRAAALLLVVLAAASVLGCGSPATDGAPRASITAPAPASSTSAASPTVTPLATSTLVSTPTPTAGPTATLPVIAPPPPPPPTPAAAAPRPAPETHTVGMVGVAFGADLTIEAGSTVVWVNRDPVDHDISALDSSWSSPVVRPGESFQRRFDQPGVFRYVCTLHALVMQSTLTVR